MDNSAKLGFSIMGTIGRLRISYNPWILATFVVFEVLLFKTNNAFKLSLSVLEYVFILVAFLKNREIGIMYLFSFVVLTLGWLNYLDYDEQPLNFWGIRLFGFSVSILVSGVLLALNLIANRFKLSYKKNIYLIFPIFLFFYGLVAGLIRLVQGINYGDNFTTDALIFFSAIMYITLLSEVSTSNVFLILKNVIPVTVLMLLLSMITGNKLTYTGTNFSLENSVSFILPFAVILMKRYYSPAMWWSMVLVIIYALLSESIYIGGKTIIILFLIATWYSFKNIRLLSFLSIPLLILFFNLSFVLEFLISVFSTNDVIAFKLAQIKEVFEMDVHWVANQFTSMGNLIAEFLTVSHHLQTHPFILLFGNGFGGGVPDYYGYLLKGAGHTGYATIDAIRNNYFGMHLPILNIALKYGIFILGYYIWLCIKSIRNKNRVIGLFFFILFFMLFSATKEFLLLTLLFAALLGKNNDFAVDKHTYTYKYCC